VTDQQYLGKGVKRCHANKRSNQSEFQGAGETGRDEAENACSPSLSKGVDGKKEQKKRVWKKRKKRLQDFGLQGEKGSDGLRNSFTDMPQPRRPSATGKTRENSLKGKAEA